MIAWIYNLLIGKLCNHKWHVIKSVRVISDLHGTYTEYHLQCEHCGNIKRKGAY
jgi:uncharacterized protein CbrC (UPF0167 family)